MILYNAMEWKYHDMVNIVFIDKKSRDRLKYVLSRRIQNLRCHQTEYST